MATQTDLNQTENQISHSLARLLSIALSLTFVFSGAFVGYLLYGSVKNTVATMEVPTLPYLDLTLPSVTEGQTVIGVRPTRGGEIPITGITGVPLPDYEKQERVNILLLGIDKRPNEEYSRTDTMILVTIDPENKTAGMLSIPRDLYVEIPGYEEQRINTAHYLGEKYNHPGGGPALAMQAVQYNLGVPIHFYVKVDFDGFRQIVDTLGGITVDVPYAIDDPTFPDQNHGYDPFYIDAGVQTLDGVTALKYARSRHAPGSDFGRAARQQQILVAIKDKALKLGIITKIPDLWATMAGTVETDLQLVDILELADLAQDIGTDDIETFVINQDYTIDYTTDYGAMVLLPIREKIEPVIKDMFAEVEVRELTELEKIAIQAQQQAELERDAQEQQRAELKAQLEAEGASIVIQNGTDRSGIEVEIAAFLRDQGFQISHFGPADLSDYPHTVIVDYSGKEYTLGTLATFFEVSDENIRRSGNLQSDYDIRVIVGKDFELPAIPQESTQFIK